MCRVVCVCVRESVISFPRGTEASCPYPPNALEDEHWATEPTKQTKVRLHTGSEYTGKIKRGSAVTPWAMERCVVDETSLRIGQ